MPIKAVKTVYFVCSRCGHEWIPRDPRKLSMTCPNCRSPYWNKPRVRARAIKLAKSKTGGK